MSQAVSIYSLLDHKFIYSTAILHKYYYNRRLSELYCDILNIERHQSHILYHYYGNFAITLSSYSAVFKYQNEIKVIWFMCQVLSVISHTYAMAMYRTYLPQDYEADTLVLERYNTSKPDFSKKIDKKGTLSLILLSYVHNHRFSVEVL